MLQIRFSIKRSLELELEWLGSDLFEEEKVESAEYGFFFFFLIFFYFCFCFFLYFLFEPFFLLGEDHQFQLKVLFLFNYIIINIIFFERLLCCVYLLKHLK